MQTVVPDKLDEPSPICPLAIVEFARENQEEWTEPEVLILLRYIIELPRNDRFLIVISCFPGMFVANILMAFRRLSLEKHVKYHLEFGTYSRLDGPKQADTLFEGVDELLFLWVYPVEGRLIGRKCFFIIQWTWVSSISFLSAILTSFLRPAKLVAKEVWMKKRLILIR